MRLVRARSCAPASARPTSSPGCRPAPGAPGRRLRGQRRVPHQHRHRAGRPQPGRPAHPGRRAGGPGLLLLAGRAGMPVSALAGALPRRFTPSDRLKDFPTELSQARASAPCSEGGDGRGGGGRSAALRAGRGARQHRRAAHHLRERRDRPPAPLRQRPGAALLHRGRQPRAGRRDPLPGTARRLALASPKRPICGKRLAHCGVLFVRLIPQDSPALHLDLFEQPARELHFAASALSDLSLALRPKSRLGCRRGVHREESVMKSCPCGSQKSYEECCGPLITGAARRRRPSS